MCLLFGNYWLPFAHNPSLWNNYIFVTTVLLYSPVCFFDCYYIKIHKLYIAIIHIHLFFRRLLRKCIPTWLIKWHCGRRMEERGIMVERRAITKLELSICCREVRKPRWSFFEAAWRKVHGESPHLAGGPEKRAPSHGS